MKGKTMIMITSFMLVMAFSCRDHGHDHDGHIKKHQEEKSLHSRHDQKKEPEKHEEHHGHDDNDDHDVHEEPMPGAVIKADEEKGIQVLPEALGTIGVTKLPLRKYTVPGKKTYRVPARAVVSFEMNRGCYLKGKDWFRQEKVSLVKRERNHAVVIIPGARRNDELVVSGAPLMRLTWLEAFGASGHGHGH